MTNKTNLVFNKPDWRFVKTTPNFVFKFRIWGEQK